MDIRTATDIDGPAAAAAAAVVVVVAVFLGLYDKNGSNFLGNDIRGRCFCGEPSCCFCGVRPIEVPVFVAMLF